MRFRVISLFCITVLLIVFCIQNISFTPKTTTNITNTDDLFVNESISYTESDVSPCIRRISDVKIDPNQPDILYSNVYESTTRKNVIYKSIDAGKNWEKISILPPVYGKFTLNTKDSKVLYLISGNSSGGIKSMDGGITWNELLTVPKIINPQNEDIMYSTGTGGLFKSINGGISWTDIKEDSSGCRTIAIAYQNPQILYAYCTGKATAGIYKSSNSGEDWEIVLPWGVLYINNIVALAIDPQNSEIVYAGTSPEERNVYRSIDGGKHWDTVKNGLPQDKLYLSYFPMILEFNPINSNIIYIGTHPGVFKSIDSGKNWQSINNGLPSMGHATALAINTNDPDIIYVGIYGTGIFKSIDGGETWSLSSDGIDCGPYIPEI